MDTFQAGSDLEQFSGLLRDPVLLLEKNGRILSILNRSTVNPESMNWWLEQQSNVMTLFDFTGFENLESALRERKEFLVRENPYSFYELTYNFFMTLPMYVLKLFATSHGRFIGVVQRVQLTPTTPLTDPNWIFYMNRKSERLMGFSRSFADQFQGTFERYTDLLNQPIATFLTPSPMDIQREYFRRLHAEPVSRKPTLVLENNALYLKMVCLGTTTTPLLSEGCLIDNTQKDGHQIYMAMEPFLGKALDFDFMMEVVSSEGFGPIFLWGKEEEGRFHPDNGYMVGMNHSRNRAIVKKRGDTLVQGEPFEVPEHSVWHFEKRGQRLTLKLHDQTVLSFYDFQMGEVERSVLSFSVRPGYRFRLNRCTLRWYPANENSMTERHVPIHLLGRKKNNALLSFLPNPALATHWPDCMGFLLTDITPLEKKAEQYREKYVQARALGEALTHLLAGKIEHTPKFIGESPLVKTLLHKVHSIAPSDIPVLIEGETGTGKEVVARLIHLQSLRCQGPFVKIDCSVFSQELLESELFGHEKGAFTGAVQRKIGRFEQAEGGTVFLDEIQNLSRTVQAKLLGVLQDHAIFRVGGNVPIPLNLRVVAASNVSLQTLLYSGQFREDLFYRISTVHLTLPTLSERLEDLPLLTTHFLEQLGASQRGIVGLSAEAFQRLYAHAWPGNVRELHSVLYRALLFCTGDRIQEEHLQLDMPVQPISTAYAQKPPSVKRKTLLKEEVIEALAASQGNVRKAAAYVHASRKALYDSFTRFDIDPDWYRAQR